MKRAFSLALVFAFLGLTSAAWGAMMPASIQKAVDFKELTPNTKVIQVFDDGFDPPQPGWTLVDNSAYGPMFHPDPYNADPMDPCADGLSWWCGQFECSYLGGDGYANSWTQWLLYENVDLTGYTVGSECLILTFHGRYDSEFNYDFTYVQAFNPVTLAWDNLNPGYDGSSGGWFDLGLYGFVLDGAACGGVTSYIQGDNTVDVRFTFISDSGYSDADGLYDSNGGSFNVDAVKIFEFFSGATYLFECDQSIGVAGPAPVPAGNYWNLSQRGCLTWWSPPNTYVCDDADTTALPGGLNCWLITPHIDVSGMATCTVWYAANMHYDYDATLGVWYGAAYGQYATLDGGACWYNIATYIGDMERSYQYAACDVAGWFTVNLDALMASLPADRDLQFAISTETDAGGAFGCAAGNNCWWALLHTYVTANPPVAVEPTGWGDIKTMFK